MSEKDWRLWVWYDEADLQSVPVRVTEENLSRARLLNLRLEMFGCES